MTDDWPDEPAYVKYLRDSGALAEADAIWAAMERGEAIGEPLTYRQVQRRIRRMYRRRYRQAFWRGVSSAVSPFRRRSVVRCRSPWRRRVAGALDGKSRSGDSPPSRLILATGDEMECRDIRKVIGWTTASRMPDVDDLLAWLREQEWCANAECLMSHSEGTPIIVTLRGGNKGIIEVPMRATLLVALTDAVRCVERLFGTLERDVQVDSQAIAGPIT